MVLLYWYLITYKTTIELKTIQLSIRHRLRLQENSELVPFVKKATGDDISEVLSFILLGYGDCSEYSYLKNWRK